jgi:hypothetical protein
VGCVREEIEGLFSPHGWRIAGKKAFPPGFAIPMFGGEAESLNIRDVSFRYRNLEYQNVP